MKRIALAVLLAMAAPVALAAADAIPPHTCGALPEYPGRLGTDLQKRTFDKAYKAYDKCVRAYIDDRVATIKANEAAVNKVVDETNAVVLQMRAASGEDVSKEGKDKEAPKMDSGGKQGSKY
ncbi:hypothetical protein BWI17_07770 [Betaproteobacteria bacterium GR16-43]|nr:hypothetical protein BWI17_07770 [Betaproteobacteria bacterium GR16-43]